MLRNLRSADTPCMYLRAELVRENVESSCIVSLVKNHHMLQNLHMNPARLEIGHGNVAASGLAEQGYYKQQVAALRPVNASDPLLRNWTKPAGNPLAISVPPGVSWAQFRDPHGPWQEVRGLPKLIGGSLNITGHCICLIKPLSDLSSCMHSLKDYSWQGYWTAFHLPKSVIPLTRWSND